MKEIFAFLFQFHWKFFHEDSSCNIICSVPNHYLSKWSPASFTQRYYTSLCHIELRAGGSWINKTLYEFLAFSKYSRFVNILYHIVYINLFIEVSITEFIIVKSCHRNEYIHVHIYCYRNQITGETYDSFCFKDFYDTSNWNYWLVQSHGSYNARPL